MATAAAFTAAAFAVAAEVAAAVTEPVAAVAEPLLALAAVSTLLIGGDRRCTANGAAAVAALTVPAVGGGLARGTPRPWGTPPPADSCGFRAGVEMWPAPLLRGRGGGGEND